VLTVIDTFPRFVPTLDPRFSYRGEDVVATLERVCGQVGNPKTIRVDQGSEFISRDLDRLPTRRRARHLTPVQAHRQRFHRGVQRAAYGRNA
jgi:transposase InsO family protein